MSIADDAWDRYHTQHQARVNLKAFATSLYPPLENLAYSIQQLTYLRSVDTAQGDALDRVGSIVGITRVIDEGVYIPFFGFITQPSGRNFGVARMRHTGEPWAESTELPDADFRTLIKLKIALNNGHGLAENLEDAAKLIFHVDKAFLQDDTALKATLFIGRVPALGDQTWNLYSKLLPRLGGVKIVPSYWDETVQPYPDDLIGAPT